MGFPAFTFSFFQSDGIKGKVNAGDLRLLLRWRGGIIESSHESIKHVWEKEPLILLLCSLVVLISLYVLLASSERNFVNNNIFPSSL